jgi:uncharacterized repeat protein (TIGR01451 family)
MVTRTLLSIPLLILALATIALPVRAQQATEPEALVMSTFNITAAADSASGQPRGHDIVQGGDVVRYSLLFTNVTDRPVRQIVLSNAVPAGFRMVAGSATTTRQDAGTEYSADAGATWAAVPMEEVLIDGRQELRPIPPERFTHVRWSIDGWVAPEATVTAEFHVRLGAIAETTRTN